MADDKTTAAVTTAATAQNEQRTATIRYIDRPEIDEVFSDSVTGLLYGDSGNQLLMQIYAALFIIAYNIVGTFIILKVISIFVPLRMDETTLRIGDDAVHGETAYNFGDGEEPAVAE